MKIARWSATVKVGMLKSINTSRQDGNFHENKYIFAPIIKDNGKGNKVSIGDKTYARKVVIEIYGDNNEVIIGDGGYMHNVHLTVGFTDCPINNAKIHIGNGVACNSLKVQMGESESECIIGDGTIISFNVEMTCSDNHCILNEKNELMNVGKKIEIGKGVWICKNVFVMKNTKIADHSIVALGSIVTKKFDTPNVILAGNPAKVVKEGIHWDLARPQQFLDRLNG